jgi:uncharacterized membrane protein YdjX (TVP38/TMEM64 family)
MKKVINQRVVLNILVLIIMLIIIGYFTIKYAPWITRLTKKPDEFRDFILSFGKAGILIFMFFQFIQVIIAAIPGEAVQLAGGYIYGGFLGTLYSVIGILAGSITAFYMARIVGLPLVKHFVPQEKFKSLANRINTTKSEIIIFIFFLIPGIPKDILVYACGISPINPLKFFAVILIARLPGIIGSSIIGANIFEKNYITAIILSVIAVVLFSLGILLKDKILNIFHISLKE